MYSGNLGVVHETDALIEVVRRLDAMPEVCVLFVGEGQGKTRLEESVRREGLQGVRFLGYQAQEALQYSLSAGDIHLVTLRPEMEGLSVPSKVYGIMAVGRPVVFIGPEGSEVAALVREAGCGEVFSPAEHEKATSALLTLSQDAERRERLGMAGRRYFEAFLDRKFAIQRFRALFDSVARLNATEPSKVGQSDSWSNPETKSHGSSTILKVFHSNGMTCHLVRHHIVAARPPSRNYRLTWCRTATGEWKTKG